MTLGLQSKLFVKLTELSFPLMSPLVPYPVARYLVLKIPSVFLKYLILTVADIVYSYAGVCCRSQSNR